MLFSIFSANTCEQTVGLQEQCWTSATQGSLFVSVKLENSWRNMIERKRNVADQQNTQAVWSDQTMCVGIDTSCVKCRVTTGDRQTRAKGVSTKQHRAAPRLLMASLPRGLRGMEYPTLQREAWQTPPENFLKSVFYKHYLCTLRAS